MTKNLEPYRVKGLIKNNFKIKKDFILIWRIICNIIDKIYITKYLGGSLNEQS